MPPHAPEDDSLGPVKLRTGI